MCLCLLQSLEKELKEARSTSEKTEIQVSNGKMINGRLIIYRQYGKVEKQHRDNWRNAHRI